MLHPHTRFTTAPPAYDGFGTRTVAPAGTESHTGKAVREVAIEPDALAWQESRYASGMHGSLTRAEWERWVAVGMIVVEAGEASEKIHQGGHS